MKLLRFSIVLFLAFQISSCDKDFEEINKNRLEPTEVRYEALFNELVNSLRLGWNRQLFMHNEVLYDVTELGVVTAQTFGNIDDGAEDVWSNYYSALKNARELKRQLEEFTESDPEIADIVRAQLDILMAYKTFQVIDLFGAIPYEQAGKAFIEPDLIRPAYDDDKEIYLSLLDDLKEASITLLNAPSTTALGNNYLSYQDFDGLFNNNLSLWAKFSNSLQLKYLLRIADKESELAETEISFMLQNGYDFIGLGEDVVMRPIDQNWINEGVNWSFREHNKLRLGSTMWNFMTDEDQEIIDPRANIFFEPNVNEEWVPFPQIPGENTPQSGGTPYDKDTRDNSYERKGEGNIYASFNFYLVRDEQYVPEILMTAAEVKFLLAEVFAKGIGTAPDLTLASFRLQEGMLQDIEFWQDIVVSTDIWVNQPDILTTGELFQIVENEKYKILSTDSPDEALAKIYAQRWVSYFRQPWEAFSLMRQTNLLPLEKENNDFFRFKYPISETSFNTENWNAQVAKMGGDENNVKLWWME